MPSRETLQSICYERNYLTEVIVRVDFVGAVAQVVEDLSKPVLKAALAEFPIDEPRPVFTQEFQVKESKLLTRRHESTHWNFFSRNRDKQLTITPDALYISYKQYEKYEVLRSDFLSIINPFFESFDDAQPSRLGLRFINQFDFQAENPLDWHDYISERLLGFLDYSVEGAIPTRLFHNLEFAYDDFNLRFNFGIHNPDYPAPIKRRQFILDYDAYFKGLLESADLSNNLDAYHNAIQTVFESNITETTRDILHAKSD
jgi:uncharacterized protein (TIGR04255 family)